jgi:aminoglycoside phosphotransferase (APT) family kinase protein
MSAMLDVGRPVRPGEALDVAAVDGWLKAEVPSLRGAPQVTQYAGGASNWTYRLEYENRDLILRRPPAGTKAKSAHDMAREHRVQQALRPVFPAVPAMVALCQDPTVIGVDFYVMERIAGLIPRKELPPGLVLDEAQRRALCCALVDKLVELHRVDPAAIGLASLGRGPGYPRRQIEGWVDRYRKARTWNVGAFEGVRAWLEAHIPDDAGTCVIHNDWRLDNVVLAPEEPTRIIGVLDWELSTVGDPLMDLGCALAYWVEAGDDRLLRALRRQPTHLPGMLTRKEVVARYFEQSGRAPVDFTFYEVYGLYRLCGIAQQIYFRYFHKQTRNPAFRWFWIWVNYLGWRCRRILSERG